MRQTFSYDEYGHLRDMVSFDGAGNYEGRVFTRRDKTGAIMERSICGKDGRLEWQQIYDPETQVEQATGYDESDKVTQTWTVHRGNLISFWELSDLPSQLGDNFNERVGDDDVNNYACGNDGKCELSRIHYEYLDAEEHNLKSAEWNDSGGDLRYAAYYKYEIDSFGNWTYREVWVWTPELAERTLYETDFRTVTYWPK